MLSICIPVYNYKVDKLVIQLSNQCKALNIDFEIIVFEDGSDLEKRNDLSFCPFVKHLVNDVNLGRSVSRNILAKTSVYDKILFLDCDSSIIDENFIKNYIDAYEYPVVCGGTLYLQEQKEENKTLRLRYGMKREMVSASVRNFNPNKSFATNNFLISRNVFEKVSFCESLKKYGHEDSLFGFELKQNNITIFHINNAVVHLGVESNGEFINKTLCAIDNLILIEKMENINPLFTSEIKLISTYERLKKIGLSIFVLLFFNIFGKGIKKHLIESTRQSIFLFDLYKLGYFIKRRSYENKRK